MDDLGPAIKHERQLAGVTQEELAKLSNITRDALARYETGDRPTPAKVAVRIAKALGIDYARLIGMAPVQELVRRRPDRRWVRGPKEPQTTDAA